MKYKNQLKWKDLLQKERILVVCQKLIRKVYLVGHVQEILDFIIRGLEICEPLTK